MGGYPNASKQDLKKMGISITRISDIFTTKFVQILWCLLYIHITAKIIIIDLPIHTTNVSRLVLQLSLPNPLTPGVKWRMKIQLEVLRCHYNLYVVGRGDINTLRYCYISTGSNVGLALNNEIQAIIYLILWRRCVPSLVEEGGKRDLIMTPWHSDIL